MTGQELRALRLAWGMTQAEFARVLGYTIKAIANYEHGRQNITKSLEYHVIAEHKLRQVKKILDSS